MKHRFSFLLLTSVLAPSVLLNSCKKETTTQPPTNTACDVRGIYTGTNTSSTGVSATSTYKLQDNNLALGSVTPTGPVVTYGGYRNTCDSVVLSVYYVSNNSYYLLQGRLSNNGKTISGSFKNLTTTTDFGTFNISKP
jgi:hypothetical protein